MDFSFTRNLELFPRYGGYSEFKNSKNINDTLPAD